MILIYFSIFFFNYISHLLLLYLLFISHSECQLDVCTMRISTNHYSIKGKAQLVRNENHNPTPLLRVLRL